MNIEQNNLHKTNFMLKKLHSKKEDRTIQQLLYNETRNVVRPRELLASLI